MDALVQLIEAYLAIGPENADGTFAIIEVDKKQGVAFASDHYTSAASAVIALRDVFTDFTDPDGDDYGIDNLYHECQFIIGNGKLLHTITYEATADGPILLIDGEQAISAPARSL